MLVTMTQTRRGSPDGFKVERYESGKTYEMADMLARRFVGLKYATPAKEEV